MPYRSSAAREDFATLVDLDKEFVGRAVQFLERGLHGAVGGVLHFPDTVPGVTGHGRDRIRYPIASLKPSQIIYMNIHTSRRDRRRLRFFDDNGS